MIGNDTFEFEKKENNNNDTFIVKSFSWTILNSDKAIKTIDETCLKYNQSPIPLDVIPFFGITNLTPGERIPISLSFAGNKFNGKLVCKNRPSQNHDNSSNIYLIEWPPILQEYLTRRFRYIGVGTPSICFKKRDLQQHSYDIMFGRLHPDGHFVEMPPYLLSLLSPIISETFDEKNNQESVLKDETIAVQKITFFPEFKLEAENQQCEQPQEYKYRDEETKLETSEEKKQSLSYFEISKKLYNSNRAPDNSIINPDSRIYEKYIEWIRLPKFIRDIISPNESTIVEYDTNSPTLRELLQFDYDDQIKIADEIEFWAAEEEWYSSYISSSPNAGVYTGMELKSFADDEYVFPRLTLEREIDGHNSVYNNPSYNYTKIKNYLIEICDTDDVSEDMIRIYKKQTKSDDRDSNP